MQRIACAIALNTLVVIGACGGDDEGGRPNVATSEDTVCDAVADVACFNMYQCCSEGEIEDALNVSDPRTESECRDDVRAICERQKAVIDFSIKNNRVTFDAQVLNACLEALEAPEGSCATIAAMLPWAEPCLEDAWTGTVATGGQCDFAFECTQDNVCNSSRICTALPGDGMACVNQACATGLYCNIGTCRPQVAEGAICASTIQCQKGFFCDTTAETRTCTKLHALGEKCSGPGTCAAGGTCLPGTCAGSPFSCTRATECSAHCADDNSSCFFGDDSTCSIGTCSGTTTTCFSNTSCVSPSTCVFPVKCLAAECVGDVVCAEQHLAVDYCEAAMDSLPFFRGAGGGGLGSGAVP
jgi:hypothetical protein